MTRPVTCPHCGASNTIDICPTCGRTWVLGHADADAADGPCAFDRLKAAGQSAEAVRAGLRQKICIACRTEFLSSLR